MKSKIVEFQKISVRNFLSYGDNPIEVTFKNGITFVTGFNKDENSNNGVGKTSLIVESLSFLLFGETYRDINQKDIKHEHAKKSDSCIVEGWLKVNGDEMHITRSISPNKLILSINGESEKYTKSIPETTKDIIDRIGIPKTVFTNTIVMTNKESMSFLNQKKELKTKFIEGILGLEAFAEFLKLAKEESKLADELRSKKYQEVTQTERDLESDKVYFQRHEDRTKQEIESLTNKINDLESCQPVDNTEAIESLHNSKQEYGRNVPEKTVKLEKATEKKLQITYALKQKKDTLLQLSSKQTTCPSCKRPFEEHDAEQIDKEKAILVKEIEDLTVQIAKFDKAIAKVRGEVAESKRLSEEADRKIQQLNRDQQAFVKSQAEINSVKADLQRIQTSSNPFTDKIAEATLKLQACNDALAVLIKKSSLASVVKELASPTGVKAVVISKIIDTLNARINHYLNRLRSPFTVKFDEFFEESFTSKKNGRPYSYGSLSGGEAKRVDFAMLFAFRDIRRLQSNVHINITVMDELFDSALCEHGMQSIMDMLKENTEECFMIVTHRPQNIEVSNCDLIDLIKENGVTRLNVAN